MPIPIIIGEPLITLESAGAFVGFLERGAFTGRLTGIFTGAVLGALTGTKTGDIRGTRTGVLTGIF